MALGKNRLTKKQISELKKMAKVLPEEKVGICKREKVVYSKDILDCNVYTTDENMNRLLVKPDEQTIKNLSRLVKDNSKAKTPVVEYYDPKTTVKHYKRMKNLAEGPKGMNGAIVYALDRMSDQQREQFGFV